MTAPEEETPADIEIANAEARREALAGEYVFSSDSADEIMEFLNRDDI